VGAVVGVEDGLLVVGAGVGASVGAEDGSPVGAEDGLPVGAGVGASVGAEDGLPVGTEDGFPVGAGVYDTWKSIESVIVSSSVHVIVIVYSLTSASPEVTCICWPSLTIVVEPMTFPSRSATTTSSMVQAFESPR